jgi:hypothetical protein
VTARCRRQGRDGHLGCDGRRGRRGAVGQLLWRRHALFRREALFRLGGYAAAGPGVAHVDFELLSRLAAAGGTSCCCLWRRYAYRAGSPGSVFNSRTAWR